MRSRDDSSHDTCADGKRIVRYELGCSLVRFARIVGCAKSPFNTILKPFWFDRIADKPMQGPGLVLARVEGRGAPRSRSRLGEAQPSDNERALMRQLSGYGPPLTEHTPAPSHTPLGHSLSGSVKVVIGSQTPLNPYPFFSFEHA
jgi:hypothetical protein